MNEKRLAAILTPVALIGSVLCAAVPGGAQEEERKLGWSDVAELSLVATGGNAEAQTLGFRNTLTRFWEGATFSLDAGGLRAETTTTARFAVGSPDAFSVREEETTEVTAENYFLRGRYDRQISDRLFWYAGAGWDRNEFAGIRNRTYGVGGVGHIWFDDETARFRTDYGISFTRQENVVEVPGEDDTFLGLRLGWDYFRQLTGSTSYGNVLIVDGNLDETSDYRADWTNWLAVAMSERLALKISLQLLYDNEPSFVQVALLDPVGEPTGDVVLAPLDELDSIFTVALVATF